MKSCNDCKYALMEDFGYSNYTTEGTTFYCMAFKHPEDGFDRFYGEEEKLNYADKCETYIEGDRIDMDCDHENESDLTEDQKKIYEKYKAGPEPVKKETK